MTDNEIIKALEYCNSQGITSECEKCKVKNGCRSELLKNALDLINRQNAEYEDLYKKYCDLVAITNERVPELMQELQKIKEYRTEAIKEFETKLIDNLIHETYSREFLIVFIKELARRMRGDTDV